MTKFDQISYRILIVDDEPANIQLIAKILDKGQYSISYAEDGISALKMARHTTYDLVLLDVIMPTLDGFEVCKMFKEDETLKDIPIIFLTARADIEDVIKGFRIGGVDYVTKPFNDLELTARIQNHLALKSRRDALRTELNFREKVMAEFALHLERRKKLVQSFKDEIEALNKDTGNRYQERIDSLIRKLKAIFEDIDYKAFQYSFNESQERFQHRLLEKFPNLTTNEVRVCNYLRINMTTREISAITNQSLHALEAARSRLRKKLKLNSSDNLVNYLHRF